MKYPLLAICTFLSTATFAVEKEPIQFVTPKLTEEVKLEQDFTRRAIPYVKLGSDYMVSEARANLLPEFGFGLRTENNEHAVDVSFSYSHKLTWIEGKEVDSEGHSYTWGETSYLVQTLHPKIAYLTFLSPRETSSFFYGVGSGWATICHEKANRTFSGVIGNASIGYETGRNSVIRQIFSLDLYQPVLPFYAHNPSYLPTAELTYSLGF